MGVYSQIKRLLKARTNQADKPVERHYRVVRAWRNGSSPQDCIGIDEVIAYVKEKLELNDSSDELDSLKIIPDRNWETRERQEYLALKSKYELPQRLPQTDNQTKRSKNATGQIGE